MKRLFAVALAPLALGALVLHPAQAAEPISFTDPAGDATARFAPVPESNVPELDLLGGSFAYDGKNFVATWKVASLSDTPPVPSTGISLSYSFTFGDGEFSLDYIKGLVDGEGAQVVATDVTTDSGSIYPCEACRVKTDPANGEVSITVSAAAMSSLMKGAVPTIGSFKPGATFADLTAEAGSYVGSTQVANFTFVADDADLPADLVF